MSFRIITTPSIVHDGPASRNDYVIVRMTTGSQLMFNTYQHRYGPKRFDLSYDSWPKKVRDKVDEMSRTLRRAGREPYLSDFSAILTLDGVLAIGEPIIVTVASGRWK